MKSRRLMSFAAIALFATLAVPHHLSAQQPQNIQQPRYKLIDIGTLGGPNSAVPTVFYEINGSAGARGISNHGAVTGTADTSTADPLCYLDDCFYPTPSHGATVSGPVWAPCPAARQASRTGSVAMD